MKRYFLDEYELNWSGFLIDLNVQDALPLFKKAKVTNYRQDPETVHEAWKQSRTVVTANETDFVRYTLEHSKRDSGKTCQDCWGLLVVPPDKLVRDRLIPKVKSAVRVSGVKTPVPWRAIGYANLCVSLQADGSIGVRRFRRCVRCERDLPIQEEWYKSLREIAPRRK